MRKLIMLAVAAMALAIPATSMAAGNTVCDGSTDLSGTVNSNMTVPAGKACGFSGTINGNVTVNGTFKMFGGHVTGNVTVNPGGRFQGLNYGVTIDKNLTITNPAGDDGSGETPGNGFWGAGSLVKGNVTYTITSDMTYPQYHAPYLFFGDNPNTTSVNGSLNYNTGGRISYEYGSGGIPAPNMGGLHLLGSTNIS